MANDLSFRSAEAEAGPALCPCLTFTLCRCVHCQFVCCHMRVLQGCFIIFIVVVIGQRGGKKNELQSFLGLIEGCDI